MAIAGTTHPQSHIRDWIRHGLIGGILAGVTFAMFEMAVAAVTSGMEAFFMPLRMIGAIILGTPALDPGFPLLTAAAVGMALHMVLSAVYGVAIAGAARYVPALASSAAVLVLFTSAAGLALWVVNFYLIAPLAGWSWFPEETDPLVQVVAHTVMFGTVLGIYLNAAARRA